MVCLKCTFQLREYCLIVIAINPTWNYQNSMKSSSILRYSVFCYCERMVSNRIRCVLYSLRALWFSKYWNVVDNFCRFHSFQNQRFINNRPKIVYWNICGQSDELTHKTRREAAEEREKHKFEASHFMCKSRNNGQMSHENHPKSHSVRGKPTAMSYLNFIWNGFCVRCRIVH